MESIPKSRLCVACSSARAVLKRPRNGDKVCKQCFFRCFEDEVHDTIVREKLFTRGERVAIGASGGKDSTVLAHVLTMLNRRYDYGLDLVLLSIDEGITGYRDDSLETVRRNKDYYYLPLQVLSYKDLFGWTMDRVVSVIGLKSNCTVCGVFRRQALDRGADLIKADKLVTGHNADDVAETVLMNILRGDVARLRRCVSITTAGDGGSLPRCKPFKYAYEKEIVMYAYHKNLDYFSTECVYSPNAYRGYAREFLKDLEAARPSAVLDIIHAAEQMVPLVPMRGEGKGRGAPGGSKGGGRQKGKRRGKARDRSAGKSKEGCGGQGGCGAGKGCQSEGPCSRKEEPAAGAAGQTSTGSGLPSLPSSPSPGSASPSGAAPAPAPAPAKSSGYGASATVARQCERCGYMTSRRLCYACELLQGLNAGLPKVGLRGESAGESKGETIGGSSSGGGSARGGVEMLRKRAARAQEAARRATAALEQAGMGMQAGAGAGERAGAGAGVEGGRAGSHSTRKAVLDGSVSVFTGLKIGQFYTPDAVPRGDELVEEGEGAASRASTGAADEGPTGSPSGSSAGEANPDQAPPTGTGSPAAPGTLLRSRCNQAPVQVLIGAGGEDFSDAVAARARAQDRARRREQFRKEQLAGAVGPGRGPAGGMGTWAGPVTAGGQLRAREGAALLPPGAAMVAVRGGTGVAGGPQAVLDAMAREQRRGSRGAEGKIES